MKGASLNADRGLTLVEVVFALAVLVVAALALGYASSSAVVSTRAAKPRLIAQQAAQRTVDELRASARPLSGFYALWWGSAAIVSPGGPGAHVGLDATQTYTQEIDPAERAGVLAAPLDGGAFLRLRFLSEANYNALWGTTVDLDLDGTTNDGIQHDGSGSADGAAYRMFPIVVEVHYRDQTGSHVYRLPAVISDLPDLDPQRQ